MTWAYAVRDLDRAKLKAEGIEADLNEAGADGWELVSVMKLTGTIDRYVLKKQSSTEKLTDRVSEKVTQLFRRDSPDEDKAQTT